MGWLIDTDILSERARKRPDTRVLAWLEANAADVFTRSGRFRPESDFCRTALRNARCKLGSTG